MWETNIYWIIVGILEFLIVSYNFVINERGRACVRNLDLRVQSVL